jgi:hypothetical protein
MPGSHLRQSNTHQPCTEARIRPGGWATSRVAEVNLASMQGQIDGFTVEGLDDLRGVLSAEGADPLGARGFRGGSTQGRGVGNLSGGGGEFRLDARANPIFYRGGCGRPERDFERRRCGPTGCARLS